MLERVNTNRRRKLLPFAFAASLYGLVTLCTELVPSLRVGVFELSIEYMLFVPLTLAMLLDPLTVALGAATGELIFSEIMLGQFGGLGEMKKFLSLVIGVYIAGRMVTDPTDKRRIAISAISGVYVQLFISSVVDIVLVQMNVEAFTAVPGLLESIYFTESFELFNDLVVSGTLFCMLPTVLLVPRLYGRIEPYFGMGPRDPDHPPDGGLALTFSGTVWCVIGAVMAFVTKYLDERDFDGIDWRAEWAEGTMAYVVGLSVAALVTAAVMVIVYRRKKLENTRTESN